MPTEVIYSSSPFSRELFKELEILALAARREVEDPRNPFPLAVKVEKLLRMAELGVYKVFTARRDDGVLVGFITWFINESIQYPCVIAATDVFYIRPEDRGFGYYFLKWAVEELLKNKVQFVYVSMKKKHPFRALLSRMGFDQIDITYRKRLF